MPRFKLQSNYDYGFYTGQTRDSQQALMGIDWNAMVCVLFDLEGQLLETTVQPFAANGEFVDKAVTETPFHPTPNGRQVIESAFAKWRQDVIVEEATIEFAEFYLDDRFIGVEELPSHYQDFLDDSSSFSEEDRKEFPHEIREWRERGDFVFWWNEDFYCSNDGSIHSH